MSGCEFPFRVGTTSYIIPADILPNARYLAEELAGRVKDIELVLFEVEGGGGNLPGADVVRELSDLKERHDLSYTVHLPLGLKLGGEPGEAARSIETGRRTIDATRALEPWAYVVHLEGRDVAAAYQADPARASGARDAWVRRCAEALADLGESCGGMDLLAVENLERYPPDFVDPVLELAPASRCVDVGHLWVDGHDPLPRLESALSRTRVIHLHGVKERDHRSLAHTSPDDLDAVLSLLHRRRFEGVLTVEVFGEEDLQTSLAALDAAQKRLWLDR